MKRLAVSARPLNTRLDRLQRRAEKHGERRRERKVDRDCRSYG